MDDDGEGEDFSDAQTAHKGREIRNFSGGGPVSPDAGTGNGQTPYPPASVMGAVTGTAAGPGENSSGQIPAAVTYADGAGTGGKRVFLLNWKWKGALIAGIILFLLFAAFSLFSIYTLNQKINALYGTVVQMENELLELEQDLP
ncbi:MAG: hypothetical protein K5989_10760 [Lachnospiraceae bacterium]|nr:hypothetical protein [Lachnospiraceae bacterium]